MPMGRFLGDLSLVGEGVDVALHFGLRSLGGLVSVAQLIEQSVYEHGSLRRTEEGLEFVFLNPPLRAGAFRSLRLFWNGTEVPASYAAVEPAPPAPPTAFDRIDRDHPVVLPIGERTRFRVRTRPPNDGTHRFRLELQSVAIPPLVWVEFADELHPAAAPP